MPEDTFKTLRGLYKAFIDVYENGTNEEKMLSFASAIYFLNSELGSYVGYELVTVTIDPVKGATKRELYNYLCWLLRVYAQQDKKDLEWWLFEKKKMGSDFKAIVRDMLNIELDESEHIK